MYVYICSESLSSVVHFYIDVVTTFQKTVVSNQNEVVHAEYLIQGVRWQSQETVGSLRTRFVRLFSEEEVNI